LAVKTYLEKNNKLSEVRTTSQGKRTDLGEDHVDARSIASFLNNVICKSKVAELLRVYERIPKDMMEEATHKIFFL